MPTKRRSSRPRSRQRFRGPGYYIPKEEEVKAFVQNVKAVHELDFLLVEIANKNKQLLHAARHDVIIYRWGQQSITVKSVPNNITVNELLRRAGVDGTGYRLQAYYAHSGAPIAQLGEPSYIDRNDQVDKAGPKQDTDIRLKDIMLVLFDPPNLGPGQGVDLAAVW